MKIPIKTKIPRLLVAALFLFITVIIFVPKIFALTYLSDSSVLLTNMEEGGASSLIVSFTTSSTNNGTNGSLVFSGWTGSGGTGTINSGLTYATTFNSVNCTTITGASANLPGSPSVTGTSASGTVTITDTTALTVSTSYCYVIQNAITANPTTPGQSTVALTAGNDTATNVEIDIISNDQIVVNAIVPPSFTMSLSNTQDNFTSDLSSQNVESTSGINITVNTNAKSGWILYGSDSNGGLKSTTQSYTIDSTTPGTNATLADGTEGYLSGIAGITQGTGSGTSSAITAYASSGAGNGSGLTTTPTKIAHSTGTADGAIVPIKEYAAISPLTPAATDYSDTITIIGAGTY